MKVFPSPCGSRMQGTSSSPPPYLSFPPRHIAIIAVISDHLLTPVWDVGTQGDQLFQRRENYPRKDHSQRRSETPPRAWGRRLESLTVENVLRNTPTCVGKTRSKPVERFFGTETPPRAWGRLNLSMGSRQPRLRKHPHVRGEDGVVKYRTGAQVETPPRAWGRPYLKSMLGSGDRNTPTCVGKTHRPTSVLTLSKKHPHVRGEDLPDDIALAIQGRNTPTCVGKTLFHTFGLRYYVRNTPTCVGKIGQSAYRLLPPRKHPHVRGEDSPQPPGESGLEETPPRAWGRLCRRCMRPSWSRKHPHVRGEDLNNVFNKRAFGGNTPTCVGKTIPPRIHSSPPRETPPRAWGRLSLFVGLRFTLRNTPTCVGKTVGLVPGHVECEETPPRAWGRHQSMVGNLNLKPNMLYV